MQDFEPSFRRRRTDAHEDDQNLLTHNLPCTILILLSISHSLHRLLLRARLFQPTSINSRIVLDDDDDYSNESFTAIAGPSSSLSMSDTGQVTATFVCTNCADLLLINAASFPTKTGFMLWSYHR
jgi:hypothetical protein